MQIIENAVYMGAATPGQGGSTPVIDELNVTPSTSAQTITAPSGTDGYSPVNVSAVDSTIDANIVAGNIKKDVNILGVTGSYEGNVPTGTMYIISNGTYNVADKAIANVNVPGAPAHYLEKTVGANGKLINSTNIINLNGVTDVGERVFNYSYYKASFPVNTAIDFSSLTTVSGQNACDYMFSSASQLISVDLSALSSISGSYGCQYMFYNCTSLTSIDLSALTTVATYGCYYMFYNCNSLTSVNLSALTTVGNSGCSNMFDGCIGLTSIDLSSLTTTSGCSGMFSGCTGLTSIDLSALTTVGSSGCYSMFNGCNKITTVDLSSLTNISGSSGCYSMFSGCSGITSVDLSALATVYDSNGASYMFSNCTGLTSVELTALTNLSTGGYNCSYMFSGCSNLTSLSFPALKSTSFGVRTTQFDNLVRNVTGCTIHFPSNLDPQGGSTVISSLNGYPNFGGTNTVLAFDLPATE